MGERPLVLVHGYSDSAEGFERWREIIDGWGRPTESVHIGESLRCFHVYLSDLKPGQLPALKLRILATSGTNSSPTTPFTTRFVEVCLNREPMPMVGENRVFWSRRRGSIYPTTRRLSFD